jgi:hypothetical protein
MPLFFSASIKRPAATAAPPIRSDVLINSIRMGIQRFRDFGAKVVNKTVWSEDYLLLLPLKNS